MTSDEPRQPIAPRLPDMVLSQWHLETIFRATNDVVLVLDGETQQIIYVNDTAIRVLGYSPESLIGTPFSRLLPEETADQLLEAELVDGVYGPMPLRCANGELGSVDVAVVS